MLRFLNSGESHGPALTAIVEGMPAGVPVTEEYINEQLSRRQSGYGRGGRMAIERDQVKFTGGVRGGYTMGTPICMVVENKDFTNWESVMSPGTGASLEERVVTRPRPGHADLAGAIKYNHFDIRNVLERASARETTTRVAVGTLARRLLDMFGIKIFSHVVQIGDVKAENTSNNYEELAQRAAASEVMCANADQEAAMKAAIDKAKADGDSLGGTFEVVITNLPVGLGSYAQWDRKLDGRLAQAVMSIQAIKGVEIGGGFKAAELPGSQVHDEIFHGSEGFYRKTNRAGGIEGGITNGEALILRAAMKPIPTLYRPLKSVDLASKEEFAASIERSDTCAVPAAAVVAEAAVAFEIAVTMVEKFGGDSLEEMKRNYSAYQAYVRQV